VTKKSTKPETHEATEASNPALARLLGAHKKIKESKTRTKREFDEEYASLNNKLDMIETALHRMMNKVGSENLKIGGLGLAYLTTKTFVAAKDWDAIWKYIEESSNLDLLQRRLAKNAVLEFIEANDGDLPPGVTVTKERAVVVRAD